MTELRFLTLFLCLEDSVASRLDRESNACTIRAASKPTSGQGPFQDTAQSPPLQVPGSPEPNNPGVRGTVEVTEFNLLSVVLAPFYHLSGKWFSSLVLSKDRMYGL